MALMVCPDCGERVSSRAPACIHCGAPISPAKQRFNGRDSVFVAALFLSGSGLLAFAAWKVSESGSVAHTLQSTSEAHDTPMCHGSCTFF